jgi:phosphoribosylanthranilate isomerase
MILKICGITNQEDATAAIEAGATAVGFNFYARSPRYIAPERAAEIVTAEGVRRVGVFVNEKRERVEEIARAARLDVAQLHGDESPADYPDVEQALLPAGRPLGRRPDAAREEGRDESRPRRQECLRHVWKALRVGDSFDIALYRDSPAEALLLDGPAAGLYGGAGKSFDWRLVRESHRQIVLAGGLDASNVAAAIEMVRPWGVDACSRIESAPGRKDRKKMSAFLRAAMAAARV